MTSELSAVASSRIERVSAKEPNQDTINVVFASDEVYAKYTGVTLASLLKSYRGARPIRVFLLLDKPLPESILEKFFELNKIQSFELQQISVDGEKFRKLKTSEGISVATYYRLVMHELLPSDVCKALYLDSDLIIRHSIDELFDITFEGAIFAGVEDTISRSYNKRFGIPVTGRHPNAGVLLMNVEMMRQIKFSKIIEEYIAANKYRVILGDQQIIAEIFHEKIKYIPIRWNVHGSMFLPNWGDEATTLNEMDMEEAKAAIDDPSIIHYTLKRKPWMSSEHSKADEWYRYLSLSPFDGEIERPEAPNSASDEGRSDATADANTLSGLIGRLRKNKIVQGFVRSKTISILMGIIKSRDTRLKIIETERQIGKLAKQKVSHAQLHRSLSNVREDPDVLLKSILCSRHAAAPQFFDARKAVEGLQEHGFVLSNVSPKDVQGGYAENIKTITRTNNFAFSKDHLPQAVFLLSQRINQDMFWECLKTAYLYDLPLYFAEVALFGAFASYFDQDATLDERRALGFMIDDLGFYFDSRQPSRIEKTLNDQEFSLSHEQWQRARVNIERITSEGITKYNKYVSPPPPEIRPNSVLVIDQKKGDASIEFAGANDMSFQYMLEAAVAENPGKSIYFKRHPDNIQKDFNAYRNRKISEVMVLPDSVSIGSIIDYCDAIYTVSSQVGFEALMRNKNVVTFGAPFYAGWGLTDDRSMVPRRSAERSIEELFYVACILQSVYVNPKSGNLIEIEDIIDYILAMRLDNTRSLSA